METSAKGDRKLIGKFGIGKLATYAIADRITYLSRQAGRILHVTCDYRSFKSDPEGAGDAVPLKVNEVTDPKVFRSEKLFRDICESVGIDADHLTNGESTWTLCVLESLKPKAAELKVGRLKWVLRTAMPLRLDFKIWVNEDHLQSSKADYQTVVDFEVKDLAARRIAALNARAPDPSWHWKSSGQALSLSSLDFAGLAEHVSRHAAQGSLLIAPSYVGEKVKKKDEDGAALESAVEHRAVTNRISCWTIEDLARVVTAAESHQIGASQIIDIVLSKFRPADVHDAVEQLLNRINMRETYREILLALRALGRDGRLPQTTRTVQHISAVVTLSANLGQPLGDEEIRAALVEMSNASRGMLRLNENAIILNGDIDELERRIAALTGDAGSPRRPGTFRDTGEA